MQEKQKDIQLTTAEQVAQAVGETAAAALPPLLVVYNSPLDYPGKVVARLWAVNKPTHYVVVGEALDEVRNMIPAHFTNIGRDENDDPRIVEVWI